MPIFSVVLAIDKHFGIGYQGTLPWRIQSDLAHFKKLTTSGHQKNTVIMGRKTWESLPKPFRPLPHRHNLVLTHNKHLQEKLATINVLSSDNFIESLSVAQQQQGAIFIIGGKSVFEEALHHPNCTYVYLTKIDHHYMCDISFDPYPILNKNFTLTRTQKCIENNIVFSFLTYKNCGL